MIWRSPATTRAGLPREPRTMQPTPVGRRILIDLPAVPSLSRCSHRLVRPCRDAAWLFCCSGGVLAYGRPSPELHSRARHSSYLVAGHGGALLHAVACARVIRRPSPGPAAISDRRPLAGSIPFFRRRRSTRPSSRRRSNAGMQDRTMRRTARRAAWQDDSGQPASR